MKMGQTFEAARPAAQHCAELTMRGPRPEERAETLAIWRRDIGRALSEIVGGLLGGGKLSVALTEPEWLTGEQIFQKIGTVAANSLLRCGGADQTALLSVDLATTIALTDRSFGGAGTIPEGSFEQLTCSAGLLIDQVAAIVANAIGSASREQADAAWNVIVHRESVRQLKPFGPATPCAAFTIEIAEEGGPSWKALLSTSKDTLDSLMPGPGPSKPGGSSGPANGGAAPFAAIPMPVEAVLAEFDLSLGKLEKLAPGDRIPIAVPRDVPLRIGPHIMGKGSVGTLEDRTAIRLTHINQGASIR